MDSQRKINFLDDVGKLAKLLQFSIDPNVLSQRYFSWDAPALISIDFNNTADKLALLGLESIFEKFCLSLKTLSAPLTPPLTKGGKDLSYCVHTNISGYVLRFRSR